MQEWIGVVLSFVGGTGLMGLITTTIWNSQKKRIEKYRKYELEQQKEQVRLIIREEVNPIKQSLSEVSNKLDNNTKGTVTLLRDRMKSALNECRKQGYASTTDKANWHELYNSYKDLGGNHFREYVDEWKHEIDSLPLHEGEE